MLNWQFLTREDHFDLLSKGDAFGESHVEPVRRELMENLIKLDHQQQINVIAFYVNELNRIAITDLFKKIEKREVHDGPGNRLRSITPTSRYKIDDPFFTWIYHLHLLLFMEIEKACKIYNIPLNRILEDQGIDPDTLFVEVPEEGKKNQVEPSLPEFHPHFIEAYVLQVFDILKEFFSGPDQAVLLELLQTGGTANEPLVFIDNGSRLADAFKQLFDCGIINGCQKKELEEWIVTNFRYRYRENIKTFTKRYIADIVSTTKDKCQRPLLNVNQDKSNGRYLIAKL